MFPSLSSETRRTNETKETKEINETKETRETRETKDTKDTDCVANIRPLILRRSRYACPIAGCTNNVPKFYQIYNIDCGQHD